MLRVISNPKFNTARHRNDYFNILICTENSLKEISADRVGSNKLLADIIEYVEVKLRTSCPLPKRATFSNSKASEGETFDKNSTKYHSVRAIN